MLPPVFRFIPVLRVDTVIRDEPFNPSVSVRITAHRKSIMPDFILYYCLFALVNFRSHCYNVVMKKKARFRRNSFKKPHRPHIKFTLHGEEGKIPRIILSVLAAVTVIVLLFVFLKPHKQLMKSPEVRRIQDRGVLYAGIRNDMPAFAYDSEGFEAELAERFAEYLLCDSQGDAQFHPAVNAHGGSAVKFVTVSSKTTAAKLSDGSVDIVIALMPKDADIMYSYSYSYYTDECPVLVHSGSENKKLSDMLIGYVQQTPAESVLKKYADEHETKVKVGLFDKISGKEPELPPDAVRFDLKPFASYPDILNALYRGRIDGAVISGAYMIKYKAEIEKYGFTRHNEDIGSIEYAITAREDESALTQLADMFIYDLQQSGELDALLKKYGLTAKLPE